MLSRYQHVVDKLRRDAADRIGQALWPSAKLRPTETTARGGRTRRSLTGKSPGQGHLWGAACRNRTDDLRITSLSQCVARESDLRAREGWQFLGQYFSSRRGKPLLHLGH
jgi:hypothetical protein